MSLRITDDRITSDATTETATTRPSATADADDTWIVSWLPNRPFDRNAAITAMTLADTLAAGATPGDHTWPLVEDLARELHLTAHEAQYALSARSH
jgi:hypothetical protein